VAVCSLYNHVLHVAQGQSVFVCPLVCVRLCSSVSLLVVVSVQT